MNNSMKEAEDYINQIPLFGPHTEGRNKSGNENLEAVMALLGNPHLAHKAIHVAGTNGKGSCRVPLLCCRGGIPGAYLYVPTSDLHHRTDRGNHRRRIRRMLPDCTECMRAGGAEKSAASLVF